MKKYIDNFVGNCPVEVSSYLHKTCGPIVSITQNIGSCHINHSMTPLQARLMASALIANAEEVEALEIAEAA